MASGNSVTFKKRLKPHQKPEVLEFFGPILQSFKNA